MRKFRIPGILLASSMLFICGIWLFFSNSEPLSEARLQRALNSFLTELDVRQPTRGSVVLEQASSVAFSLENLPMKETSDTLVNPINALPQTMQYPLEELKKAKIYSSSCLRADSLGLEKSAHQGIRKLFTWARYFCEKERELPVSFFQEAPFMHPSGKSYMGLFEKLRRSENQQNFYFDLRFLHAAELEELPEGREWLVKAVGQPFLSRKDLSLMVQRQPVVASKERVFLFDTLGESFFYRSFSTKIFDDFMRENEICTTAKSNSEIFNLSRGNVYFSNCSVRTKFFARLALLGIAVGCLWFIAELRSLFVKLKTQRQSFQKQQFFMLKMLTHEVRTPVASIRLSMLELEADFDKLSEKGQQALLCLQGSESRLSHVLEASKAYLKQGWDQAFCNERTLINNGVRAILPEDGDAKVSFVSFLDENAYVAMDPFWFSFCLTNLIDNALKYGAPPIKITAEKNQEQSVLKISDAGSLPWKKVEPRGHGLGLGISLIRDILPNFGGELKISEQPTAVSIVFRPVKK